MKTTPWKSIQKRNNVSLNGDFNQLIELDFVLCEEYDDTLISNAFLLSCNLRFYSYSMNRKFNNRNRLK